MQVISEDLMIDPCNDKNLTKQYPMLKWEWNCARSLHQCSVGWTCHDKQAVLRVLPSRDWFIRVHIVPWWEELFSACPMSSALIYVSVRVLRVHTFVPPTVSRFLAILSDCLAVPLVSHLTVWSSGFAVTLWPCDEWIYRAAGQTR